MHHDEEHGDKTKPGIYISFGSTNNRLTEKTVISLFLSKSSFPKRCFVFFIFFYVIQGYAVFDGIVKGGKVSTRWLFWFVKSLCWVFLWRLPLGEGAMMNRTVKSDKHVYWKDLLWKKCGRERCRSMTRTCIRDFIFFWLFLTCPVFNVDPGGNYLDSGIRWCG